MKRAAREARSRHVRYRAIQLAILVGVGLVLGQAFRLQVLQGSEWRARSLAQHEQRVPLPAPRGNLLDREGRALAVSRTTYRISVAPHELSDRRGASEVLRQALSLGPATSKRIAEGDARWVVLPGTHSAVRKDDLEKRIGQGIYFEPTVERFYPRGRLATELLGRVDRAGRGQSGLELEFDSLLAGQPGFGVRRRDASGASAGWLVTPVVTPTLGRDVYLTIDAELQGLAESILADAVKATSAEGGDLLIVRPETGELLAAASRRVGRIPHLAAATEPYEPGSTLKPFTAAALLAEGLAQLSDSVDTGLGRYETEGRTIKDVHPQGWLTFAQVLEVSSNVGMAKLAERLSSELQFSYLRNFGFGTRSGLSYPSESAGLLRPPGQWSAQSRASLAIGYEIAVTPLQLVMAYGAIANGGLLMRPRLVLEARDPAGTRRWKTTPELVRRVITEDVAADLRDVLAHAVAQGTGRGAGVRGISVAGKTGTARRFDRLTGYSNPAHTASFVGLIPSDVPQLVILVKLDAPSGAYYAGLTAAPVMRTAVRAALAGSHWPAPPLFGKPDIPVEKAGVTAGRVPAGGPYIFALGVPLRRADGRKSRQDLRGAATVEDVKGLSLRAAVHRLHEAGLRVRVQGRGRVQLIQPSPGTLVRRGERVVLVARKGPSGDSEANESEME